MTIKKLFKLIATDFIYIRIFVKMNDFNICFTGGYRDSVTLGYMLGNGYRVYLPWLSRNNKRDDLSPFGPGGINPYAYCMGDPVNHTDPSGHMVSDFLIDDIGIEASAVGDTVKEVVDAVSGDKGIRGASALYDANRKWNTYDSIPKTTKTPKKSNNAYLGVNYGGNQYSEKIGISSIIPSEPQAPTGYESIDELFASAEFYIDQANQLMQSWRMGEAKFIAFLPYEDIPVMDPRYKTGRYVYGLHVNTMRYVPVKYLNGEAFVTDPEMHQNMRDIYKVYVYANHSLGSASDFMKVIRKVNRNGFDASLFPSLASSMRERLEVLHVAYNEALSNLGKAPARPPRLLVLEQ